MRRWEEVLSGRGSDPAVFSPSGEVLRTFSGIEREASYWVDALPAGISPGTVAAVHLPNGPEWPSVLLACWRRGLIVVPFDQELTPDRRSRLEALCGVSLRIEAAPEIRLGDCAPQLLAIAPTECDFLKMTSGTTSEPRAVRFTSAQLLADCDAVCDTMGLRESDINYGLISFAHSYGFSNLVTPLLCRGIPLVAAGDAIPRAIVEGLRSSSATVFPSVPAIFRALSEFPGGHGALRLCISAGAPLNAESAVRFAGQWGVKIHSFYGASECGGICYDDSGEIRVPQGFVGKPLRGVSLRLLSEQGPSLIRVSSPSAAAGYFPEDDPALGAGIFEPADLLEKYEDGYVIRGRISDTINVAGRKVNPAEIERLLSGIPGVENVVVFGLPAPARGEEVAVCVVGHITEQALKTHCASILPPWQIPRKWFFRDEIPVNLRGKISRADLRRLFGG